MALPSQHSLTTPEASPGQPAGLTGVFMRLRLRLRSMATRLTGSEEEAEDALQDAFVRLWGRPLPDSEAQTAALLTTTVKNLSIDSLRRKNSAPLLPIDEQRDADPEFADDEGSQEEELFKEVQAIIHQKLTPMQQRILELRDYEGRSYDEIATMLQMQPAAVRMQLSRARKTVREVWNSRNAASH